MGKEINVNADSVDSKKKKKRKKISKKYWLLLIPLSIFFAFFYWYILRDLPSPVKLTSGNLPQSSKIYDRNNVLLYTIYDKKNQTFVALSSLPPYIPQASIAIEDKDFYNHGAIDFRGITRAFVSTVFHNRTEGGSTITQQLVKTSLLTPEQTITRKIKEAILAIITETLYPKNKILELYLNEIPYGGTTYGIEAAAQTYFGIPAKKLDIAQAALLAALPEAPSTYSPFGAHPEYAKKRQLLVLKTMQDQGYITNSQEKQAAAEPLQYVKLGNNILAPHFVLYIKDLLIKTYGEQRVEQGGLIVKTSLDMSIQTFAQDTVATEMATLKGYHVTNGAVVVTKPASGEILAMVGSRDYFNTKDTDGNVNITISQRQPGSSIKPVNYALGLINGYTAATPFIDMPICYPTLPVEPQYCPLNYDGKFHGVQSMRQSLGNSFNIPAVKMLKVNTVPAMIALANQMGIDSFTNATKYGLALTLGGGDVTMLEMTTAFGVFANGGYRINLHPILSVKDSHGKFLQGYTPPTSPIFGKRVLPPGVAFIISDILADNGARLAEFGPNSALVVKNKTVSVKTGTTNDFRDNWTIGYTPSYLVAAWVGNNDNSPMAGIASGITGAAPIWNKVMTNILANTPNEQVTRPSNVIQKVVCSSSGLLPPADGTPNRCATRFEYFIAGTEPKQLETYTNAFVDKPTQGLAKPGQTDNVEQKPELIITDPTGDKFCATCNHPELNPTPTPKP